MWAKQASDAEKKALEEVRANLLQIEDDKPWVDKQVQGDASETGLLRFIAPLLTSDVEDKSTPEVYKGWPRSGLAGFRASKPVHNNEASNGEDYKIDFSSDIKFNLQIRDMNKKVEKPETKEDNLCVLLKGAPDRVLTRCSTVLVNGQPEPLTKVIEKDILDANELYGNMGERVLGFSRMLLDPAEYSKADFFDTKGWSKWKDVKEKPQIALKGWFPMWNLEFVGLVSLNDPPRKGVDQSVLKCKAAGIKVIMVTGDQKNTGAAIAAKVNIITDKTTEFNHLVKHNGLTEQEAMKECSAIVIHGDELA